MTETQQRFFDSLNRLGTGERAALRRETGAMLREADGAAMRTFYRCLPPSVDSRQEDKWFAVACFRCLWDVGEAEGRPLEEIIANLIRRGDLSDSAGHRVEILLDTAWDPDGYMLTKLARLLKMVRQRSDRARIDFARLLDDILRWNYDAQPVQRRWARAIFGNETNKDTVKDTVKE